MLLPHTPEPNRVPYAPAMLTRTLRFLRTLPSPNSGLGYNSFTGSIPTELGGLTAMESQL